MNVPAPTAACSGVILSGGLNTRFSGREKAFIPLGGRPILDYIIDVFQKIFDEIIIVTNHPQKYAEWDCLIVSDLFSHRSSLTGIHSGLYYSSNPYIFLSACDTPCLSDKLVRRIIAAIEPGIDVVVPATTAGLEPLCAAYSKHCLQPVENRLRRREYKVQSFFNRVAVKKIPENILRESDPELLSFFNVNSPRELARIEEILSGETPELLNE